MIQSLCAQKREGQVKERSKMKGKGKRKGRIKMNKSNDCTFKFDLIKIDCTRDTEN